MYSSLKLLFTIGLIILKNCQNVKRVRAARLQNKKTYAKLSQNRSKINKENKHVREEIAV
jgi:cell division protein FtsB